MSLVVTDRQPHSIRVKWSISASSYQLISWRNVLEQSQGHTLPGGGGAAMKKRLKADTRHYCIEGLVPGRVSKVH